MAVFRINLADSFDYVIERGAFSAPSGNLMQARGEPDNTGYREVEKVTRGDVLLLCRGIRDIHAVAYTHVGCVVADVDAYSDSPEYFPEGFRLVQVKVLRFLWDAADGNAYFDGVLAGTPFKQGAMGFCLQLHPLAGSEVEFNKRVTDLMAGK